MKRLLLLVAAAAAALAGGTAQAAVSYGANEDFPSYAEDGGAAMYGQLRDVGMTQNIIAVRWDPAAPTVIERQVRLERAIAAAQARGVRVVLALYPARARAVADGGPQGMVDFCGRVARAFPQVDAFVVGNEPNQPRFWQPQFDADGSNASAAAFLPVLAGCYDVLHGLGRFVVGIGLSPRGNDNPAAPSNVSTSPVRFLAALGAAYRASGRTAPLMDAFAFHPYPNLNTDAPSVGYRWPNAGVTNLDRIKQALYDAFNGTGQPDVERGLRIWIDELGWQVGTEGLGGYSGSENVPTVDAATQASHYGEVVRRAACDPAVSHVHLFHWIDEADRDRFQSGALLADGTTRRPAYDEVKRAIAETANGTRCPAPFQPSAWAHAAGVVGASADFGSTADKPAAQTAFGFNATAEENAVARFGLVAVSGTTLGAAERNAVRDALEGRAGTERLVAGKTQLVRANFKPRLEVKVDEILRRHYVYAVLLEAETNPARQAFFVSRPFLAGQGTVVAAAGAVAPTSDVASRVLLQSALLNGGVKAPAGTRLEAWFEYGPGTTLGRRTPVQRFTGSDPTIFATVRGLSPRGKWSYRLAVRRQGQPATATRGATRSFTLTRPEVRTAPLVLVADVDEQRRGVEVDAVVSATERVTVVLRVRRLPARGQAGDPAFRAVDSTSVDTGANGRDLFLTLEANGLPAGVYLGQVVATNRGRDVVRVVRFTVG